MVASKIKPFTSETQLIHSGKLLDICCALGDYGIEKGSCIFVVNKFGITIHVDSIDKKRLASLQVDSSETILTLKARIQATVPEIPPPSQQQLTIRGSILEDSHTLKDYSVLTLSIIPKRVFVRYSRRSISRTLQVEIPSMAPIFHLKHSIHQKVAVDPTRQQLYYDGKLLDDSHTIEDCALPTESTLQLCKAQCMYDPLQEDVPSKGKQITWRQYGVAVTVPSGTAPKRSAQLRVYDDRTTTCFEYPHEYTPLSNVYEISVSSSIQSLPSNGVKVALTNFRRPRGEGRLCVMVASCDPSKWTPDQLTPVFSFSEVEGLNLELGTRRVELVFNTTGVYIFVAENDPQSQGTLPRQNSRGQRTSQVIVHPISSPEHRAMVRCTPQLTDTITADPLRVSEGLFAISLIPPAIRDQVLHNGTMTPREKASRLVASMTDRVSASPSDFAKFVSVLREQGPWTEQIVSLLEKTLTETKLESSQN